MKRLIPPSVLLLGLAITVSAQDLQQYLHLRKSYGIVESVGVPALETLVGSRVFEVQGIVKGTMRTGNRRFLLLELTDGETQAIDANNIPDWVIGSDIPARLLIKANRTAEGAEVQANLLAVARDEDIQPIEAKWIASVAKAAALRHKRSQGTSSSTSTSMSNADKSKTLSHVWSVPSDESTPTYAGFIKHHNPKLSDNECYRIAQGILGFGRRYGVDARLIVAMVICESDFNPLERSSKGAMGLGQLMPDTAQDYGITNPFDSVQNLYGTVREIRGHIDKYRNETGDEFQSLVLGLAAYNAGEGAVRRHGGIPPYRETQNYVRKVIRLYYKLAGINATIR